MAWHSPQSACTRSWPRAIDAAWSAGWARQGETNGSKRVAMSAERWALRLVMGNLSHSPVDTGAAAGALIEVKPASSPGLAERLAAGVGQSHTLFGQRFKLIAHPR